MLFLEIRLNRQLGDGGNVKNLASLHTLPEPRKHVVRRDSLERVYLRCDALGAPFVRIIHRHTAVADLEDIGPIHPCKLANGRQRTLNLLVDIARLNEPCGQSADEPLEFHAV